MSSLKHHSTGLEYWRSLEQLADTPAFREAVAREFPGYDADTIASSSRRRFLKIMGAAMALAGVTLTGCRRWPKEQLAPYSASPRDRLPGVPEQYATVLELGGVAAGLLVTSFDGRPIKIEGNPSHPFSSTFGGRLGAADALAQASVLALYDPERSRTPVDRSGGAAEQATWENFAAATEKVFGALRGSGAGFAVLTQAASGPSISDSKKRLLAKFPQAKWYEYEPLSNENELEGAKRAFGKPVRPRLHLDKADVILSLDADLLGLHPAHVRYANDWSQRRRSADAQIPTMSQMFVAESGFTITGASADERVAVDPAVLYAIASAVAAQLGVANAPAGSKLSGAETKFVEAVVVALKHAGKNGVVAAGLHADPAVHALAHAINQQLGAIGTTVVFLEDPTVDRPSHFAQVAHLSKAMAAGSVGTLLILGGNPVYDAPADLGFDKALAKVANSIHLSLYEDETSQACKWHLPQAHYLESWGDACAFDGTLSIVQPLIEPLYGGKSAIEVLALVSGDDANRGDEIVRRTWKQIITGGDFEKRYRKVLEAGVLENSAYTVAAAQVVAQPNFSPAAGEQGIYLRLDPDYRVYDGRFANNGWLQESGAPLTKLTWDNALLISKPDADRKGITTGDIVRIEKAGAGAVEAAAFVLAGQPLGVVSLSLGYGRKAAGHVGNDLGFNAYPIRTSGAPFIVSNVNLTPTGAKYVLATTQEHHVIDELGIKAIEDRVGEKRKSGLIIEEQTFGEYKAEREHAAAVPKRIGLQLFNPPSQFNDPHAWGMTIDMAACIGCNACVLACQAENNIPVVGKDQVLVHREMNWIRIDTYFKGSPDSTDVEVVQQPMMCVHCENAPCEQVCPVAATVHDSEGLNTMVYNRCIGTRYCSNNCPYKVRRFNYFDYHSKDPRGTAQPWLGMPDAQQLQVIDTIKRMVFNPEVTVRMRGVMEKCTYCTQRIHNTTVAKRASGQEVKDFDVVTACQQACPTQAIVFGNLNDRSSSVAKMQQVPRAYGVLDEELNTRPRTLYLAKLTNPAGEEQPKKKPAADEHHG